MGTQRLEERFAFHGGKVDRTGPRPVIRDVLLCGPASANRRRYTREAFAGDRVKRYAGRPVFLNHGDGRTPRRYEERIAKVINPRHRADGMPVGDLEVRPKHPFAEAFLDDAEHDPSSVGMSHVAHCTTVRGADGWDEVTEMVEAESVDVVMDPATTRGLFESTRRPAVPFTWKQFAGWVARHPKSTTAQIGRVKRVAEMDGMADAPALAAEPPPAAEPDDAITGALRQAGHDAWDKCVAGEMTIQELLKKLKDILKDHGKYAGAGAAPADDDLDADPAAEGRARKPLTLAGLITEARGFGLDRPAGADLAVLEGIPTAAGRKAYCERIASAVREGEAPRSAGRLPGAGPSGRPREAAPPADPGAYGRWLTEN